MLNSLVKHVFICYEIPQKCIVLVFREQILRLNKQLASVVCKAKKLNQSVVKLECLSTAK